MSRKQARPAAATQLKLATCHDHCWVGGQHVWVAYHTRRQLMTWDRLLELVLPVRRCHNPAWALYHRAYRPAEEAHYGLPHGEFGLDVIALVGPLRYAAHKSIPEIHAALLARGVRIAQRSVTQQLYRYEQVLALRVADPHRLHPQLIAQGRGVLALDGLQPDVGHEVLWVRRDGLSGAILLARSLLSATEDDLVPLLVEGRAGLPVPIRGVISDGQHAIRNAVARALPGVAQQLCQFHYLRDAAAPIYEADRHAKTQLKKHVRGGRPIERALAGRDAAEATASRGYCLAVRSALTDDGRPPLWAPGLRLQERRSTITASLALVAAKRGACPRS